MNKYFVKKILLLLNLFIAFNIRVIKISSKPKKNQAKLGKTISNENIKICICTLGKNENKYIREFVQHYEKYDVDKIYLYDNNDIVGERFEEAINDYIRKGFVEIINWRGITKGIYKVLNNCYKSNYEKYDWLIFYELDEFINLHNYTSIKKFLKEKRFKDCQIIYLNSVCHTDNNKLYYENKSLHERFPEIIKAKKLEIKSIIRGHIPKLIINHIHQLNDYLKNCNGFGNKNKIVNIFAKEPDYKYYYIDHYYCKSTEEFINKIKRGDLYKNSFNYIMHKINKYFSQSKLTKEKIELIENRTSFNLSYFKKKLKSNHN